MKIPMSPDYTNGILICLALAGQKIGTVTITDRMLQNTVNSPPEVLLSVPVKLGDLTGTIVQMVHRTGQLWAAIHGIDVVKLAMAGLAARQAGNVLAVTLAGVKIVTMREGDPESRRIEAISGATIEPAANADQSGEVVFTSIGLPIAFDDREMYWLMAEREALGVAVTEAAGPMSDYTDGVLVKIIEGGRAASGRTYSDQALDDIAGHISKRGVVAVRLGHRDGAQSVGRIVRAERQGNAVWGQMIGVPAGDLIAMREGARQHGIPVLGLSIKADGKTDPATGIVSTITMLESVDLCTRDAAKPLAGGMVCFDSAGAPISWRDREATWVDDRLARLRRVTEAATQRLAERVATPPARRPSAPLVTLRESNGGRLLGILA